MMQALNHATYLLQTLANAKVLKGITGLEVKNNNPEIELSIDDINKKIGVTLSKRINSRNTK